MIGPIDILVFVVFILLVIAVSLWKSRSSGRQQDTSDYFLAGRGLSWWLIGFSLIAANISTEQFVGMSGSAASHVGLAIASYEWMAAITLVIVAFCFLPYFLRIGIFTMPEFLEYRYNSSARFLMAAATVLIYLILMASVTYSGALTVLTLGKSWGMVIPLWKTATFIVVIAVLYVASGGLKASTWADLVQGTALILGGAIVMAIAFEKLASIDQAATIVDVATGEIAMRNLAPGTTGMQRFMDLNANRMNMFLPATDGVLPWTALLLGLWIPNFYYWGLNQYITQRTLGSSSLADGQKGIVFAAYLKLLIPFVVVIPGIIAFNLFSHEMRLEARGDAAVAMAKYLQANPDTQFVQLARSPDQQVMIDHKGPSYLLAVFPDEEQRLAAIVANPFVLSLNQEKYDAVEVAEFQLFNAKEDYSWQFVNPELNQEVMAFNERVTQASNGKPTTTQALVAHKYDTALGLLLGLLPQNTGLLGFVIAALLGAVISSLAAMLNAASSIFTLDLVGKYILHETGQAALVRIGRVCVVIFGLIACLLAPQLENPNISNSIFTIIQESQGLISPGILAIFIVGLMSRRCPRFAGSIGLLTSIVCYAGLKLAAPGIQFLNRMAIVFGICLGVMFVLTLIRPLSEPIEFVPRTQLDLKGSAGAKLAGFGCIAITLMLYVVFSSWGVAK